MSRAGLRSTIFAVLGCAAFYALLGGLIWSATGLFQRSEPQTMHVEVSR